MRTYELAREIMEVLKSREKSDTYKKEYELIACLIESEVELRYRIANRARMSKQVKSEILCLLDTFEKNGLTTAWINKRISLLIRTLLQTETIRDRGEVALEALYSPDKLLFLGREDCQKQNKTQQKKKKEEKKQKRQGGWHKKTWAKFNRLVLGQGQQSQQSRKKETRLTLPGLLSKPEPRPVV
jgi:hypothetical protein